MVCKYFLSVHWLFFHFVDGLLSCAEAFYFDVVPLIFYFVFWAFGVPYKKKKIIAKDNVKEPFTYFFSKSSMVSDLTFLSL